MYASGDSPLPGFIWTDTRRRYLIRPANKLDRLCVVVQFRIQTKQHAASNSDL